MSAACAPRSLMACLLSRGCAAMTVRPEMCTGCTMATPFASNDGLRARVSQEDFRTYAREPAKSGGSTDGRVAAPAAGDQDETDADRREADRQQEGPGAAEVGDQGLDARTAEEVAGG